MQSIGSRSSTGAVVEGGADDADVYAFDGDDGTVFEARQRLAIRCAQIGAVEREFGLSHALEEHPFAEIKLVVAGDENIRRNEIGECDNVSTLINAGHQRG